MTLLIIFVALAIGFSFLCSILEAVLLSINPSYIAKEMQNGHKNGKLWQKYKADIDRPLAAILSLNTIAHTVGAAGAGAQATNVFGEAYFGVISAVLTILILVFSEIIPKTLGAMYWRQLAPASAQILRIVIISVYPLIYLSQFLTRLFSRSEKHHSISRDEFTALANVGVKEGVFSQEEATVVQSLMRFKQLQSRDIMTPRSVMFTLDTSMSIEQARSEFSPFKFSRIPVYHAQKDNIVGYVRKDDLLAKAFEEPSANLESIKREIFTVPESLSLTHLFRKMTETQNHISLIVNEYGDIQGIVTMEDLIETLLGLEIVDETDTSINMRELARQLWLSRAQKLGIVEPGQNESTL